MNPDMCVHCAAAGCLDNTATHDIACPFTTGMWPVDDEAIRRKSACAACGESFSPGDLEAHVTNMSHPAVARALDMLDTFPDVESVVFVVCLPCAALDREVAE